MPEYAVPIFFAVLPVLLALLRAYALSTACSVSRNTPLQARPSGLVAYQADGDARTVLDPAAEALKQA
jgi:hypothetical protein